MGGILNVLCAISSVMATKAELEEQVAALQAEVEGLRSKKLSNDDTLKTKLREKKQELQLQIDIHKEQKKNLDERIDALKLKISEIDAQMDALLFFT